MKRVTLCSTSACTFMRAVDLELEDAHAPFRRDPVELGGERAVASADELDVLEEVAGLDPLDELLLGEEPVLAPVHLARPLRPRRRGDGDLELGLALEQALDQRSLAGPARAGDDEDRQSALAVEEPNEVSVRWRSERPPTVFDWLIRH